MEEQRSFLGKGWSFPPEFDKDQGSVRMIADEIDIEKSLHILLTTRLGERVMRPSFGCNLDTHIFESMNLNNKTYIQELIKSAILYFEPRIDLESVDIVPGLDNEGILMVELNYTIRSTNSRQNFVFPFYNEEGAGINGK